MNHIEMCQQTLDRAASMIKSVPAAELSKSTPCTEWDVRGLLDHMLGTVQGFRAGLTGESVTPPADGDRLGADPGATYAAAAQRLMQAWHEPGAIDKTLKMPFGEMPGKNAIVIVIGDQMLHTWDLAKAVGRPITFDQETSTMLLEFMHGMLQPSMRGPGKPFAEEIPCPADAPLQDRLLAFSGRQP